MMRPDQPAWRGGAPGGRLLLHPVHRRERCADTVKQLLLEEIRRIRAEGVDREIFTLCKNEKYGQLIENLENVEDSASQMADFALSGQTVAQQIATLAALTAEDADAALQKILSEERMAVMYIQRWHGRGRSWTMKRRWKNDESGAVSGAGAEL